ncbi:MAG: hypothetical protein K5905_17495 [Roseibium sp.]|uniref:hypothetical protein n=1 Tax=Roseibium sp. TaxID=1936156 RepID=UPI002634A279|nr:hypothetical protein [Roseibium sp.]MCV0427258.1 hypothetical protein [Roseibium sp.]
MSIRFVLAFVGIIFAFSIAASAAFAQQVFQVKPQGAVEILRTNKAITKREAKYGSVKIVKGVGDSDSTVLMYFAPEQGSQFTDTVNYQLAGQDKTTDVTVSVQQEYGPWGTQEIYTESFKAIFILFILAVLVESGLELLFRWRPYLRKFNTKSVNPLISFAFSLLFVSVFQLDIVSDLFNIYTQPSKLEPPQFAGYILTALIVAGGSKGVNKLLKTFGFRAFDLPEEVTGPKEDGIAWISVEITRKNAVGPVNVLYGPEDNMAVIGTITGGGKKNWFESMLFRNDARFPKSGGYSVTVDETCKLQLRGVKEDGTPIESPPEWGAYKIGKRAVIDLHLSI